MFGYKAKQLAYILRNTVNKVFSESMKDVWVEGQTTCIYSRNAMNKKKLVGNDAKQLFFAQDKTTTLLRKQTVGGKRLRLKKSETI